MMSTSKRRIAKTGRAKTGKEEKEPPKLDPVQLEQLTKREMLQMSIEIERLRKDKEQLLVKQERRFGITVDASESLKQELDKARAANNLLLEEAVKGNEVFDRLKAECLDLQEQFKSCKRQINELRKEQRLFDETKEMLIVSEDRCKRLTTVSRSLEQLLLKHHIDPFMDANKIKQHTHSQGAVTPKRTPRASKRNSKPINAVPLRKKMTASNIRWI